MTDEKWDIFLYSYQTCDRPNDPVKAEKIENRVKIQSNLSEKFGVEQIFNQGDKGVPVMFYCIMASVMRKVNIIISQFLGNADNNNCRLLPQFRDG